MCVCVCVCVCVWKWNLCMIGSHFGTSLTVGAVVQIHRQLARLDVSFYLVLPVVNQRGGTDDQSAFRNHNPGIWMVNKQTNQNLQTLNTQYKINTLHHKLQLVQQFDN